MPIKRSEKIKDYTKIDNYLFKDKHLSLKAKGLLSLILSLSDNWVFSVNGLTKVCLEQRTAIKRAMDELKQNGYCTIEKSKDNKGKFYYDYTFYERPDIDNLVTDNPSLDNHTRVITNIVSTNHKDKIDKTLNPLTKELIKRSYIEESDLDIYRYSDLFDELIQDYLSENIMKVTNYIIKNIKWNKFKDENEYLIEDKFCYFKTALINNLERFNNETVLWEDD
jgi:hypothetical protein